MGATPLTIIGQHPSKPLAVLPPNLEMPTSAATAQTLLIGAQYPFAISFLVWGLLYAHRERNSRYEEKLESMFSAGHGFGVGTLCLLSICGHVERPGRLRSRGRILRWTP